MEYFSLLNLQQEPFSNSPDPDFFYGSSQHTECLQKLELTIRLRQGMSVVLGEVGTGKTTLCRQLLRKLGSGEDRVAAHLILDPSFTSAHEFLLTICATLGITGYDPENNERQLKEEIKNFLFQKAVEQKKIIALTIDEGQKLPPYCLEILRELLNYETNNAKLLQIVIFAQNEFAKAMTQQANFSDRIATLYQLTPLNFADTRKMILFRLQRASNNKRMFPHLFSFGAMLAIYLSTKGYPRKIVMLCSKTLVSLIIQNGTRVSSSLVLACSRRFSPTAGRRSQRLGLLLTLLVLAIVTGLFSWWPDGHLPWQRPDLATSPAASGPSEVVTPVKPPVAQPPTAQFAVAGTSRADRDITATATTGAPSATLASPVTASAPPGADTPTRHPDKRQPAAPSPDSPPVARVTPIAPPSPPVSPATNSSQETRLPALSGRPLKLVAGRPLLGALRIGSGDMLSKMIARIYGRFTPAKLAIVLEANPWITTVDTIPAGAVVRFPAASRPYPFHDTGTWFIELGSYQTLQDAYAAIRGYPASKAPLLLLPYRRPETGLTFAVIANQRFVNRQAAAAALERFPAAYRATARLLTGWGDDVELLSQNLGNL